MVDQLYQHILVPTDFRPASREVYRAALALAQGSNARITLLHVLPVEKEEEYIGLDAIRLMHRAAERMPMRWDRDAPPSPEIQEKTLKRLQTEIHPDWQSAVRVSSELRSGDLVEEIVRFIDEANVDLVAMASSRPRWARFGSTADRLARRTPVRIMKIVPPARVKV